MKVNAYIVGLLAIACAGCSTTAALPLTAPPSVTIVNDSYCRLGEKWRWDPKDTEATINQARRVNAKYDRTCRKKG